MLVVWLAFIPAPLAAQGTQGQNTVHASPTNTVGSSAFIDASQFAGTTFCSTIYSILSASTYPAAGAVVDARGLNSNNTNMTCAAPWTPWSNGTNVANVPSTILLPPTGTTPIKVSATWYVPSYTKLIGEGENNSPGAGSTIQAASGFSGAMINLGPFNSVSRVDIGGNAG